MPKLLDTLQELFGTQDLYQVLGIVKKASEGQIKKAYHKVSLQVHPDRVQPEERETATRKFQALGATYKILSTPESRALYDESGEIDDENDPVLADPNRDWEQYWRVLFKKISVEDIKEFEKKYRNSVDEKEDLKKAYLEGKGDMDYILETVLCSTYDDEERFTELIRKWIKDGTVKDLKKFSKESKGKKDKRKQVQAEEEREAEEAAKELGLTDEDSLKNMIMMRQAQRAKDADSFLDQLAAKYAKPSGGKKKK